MGFPWLYPKLFASQSPPFELLLATTFEEKEILLLLLFVFNRLVVVLGGEALGLRPVSGFLVAAVVVLMLFCREFCHGTFKCICIDDWEASWDFGVELGETH